MKKHVVSLLCSILIFMHVSCVLTYAETTIYALDTTIKSDEEFITGLKAEDNRIKLSEITATNKWYLFDYLIYTYMPQAFFQDWQYECKDGRLILCIWTLDYENFYISIKDTVYERMKAESGENDEYSLFINGIISEANIPEGASDKEKIICISKQIAKYTYDVEKFFTLILDEHIPGWKIMRDYNISVCDSDSKTLKMCANKLGIKCRILESEHHAWNQVFIDDAWVTVDITKYRYRKDLRYLFFSSENSAAISIFE